MKYIDFFKVHYYASSAHHFSMLCGLLFVVVMCVSCSNSVSKTHFYTLSILADPIHSNRTSTMKKVRVPTVGVYPLRLPDYLKHNGIVTEVHTNIDVDKVNNILTPSKVMISKEQVWAGELDREATRILSVNLERLLNTHQIKRFPWSGIDPGIVIKIVVDDFVGSFDKGVRLSGQIEIIDDKMSPKTSYLYPFYFNESLNFISNSHSKNAKYQEYVRAHSRALNKLSEYIVTLINN